MNRDQAKELLPIIQAFAEGKTIQARIPENDHDFEVTEWTDCTAPDFIEVAEYRIKPLPREWWINPTVDDMKKQLSSPFEQPIFIPDCWIKVREVLDD